VSIEEVWVLILGFFVFLSAVSLWFSLYHTIDVDWDAWKGRLECLWGI